MNNRVVIKRDPPEHGFGLWPGSGKVAGKVLIVDLGWGHDKNIDSIVLISYLSLSYGIEPLPGGTVSSDNASCRNGVAKKSS